MKFADPLAAAPKIIAAGSNQRMFKSFIYNNLRKKPKAIAGHLASDRKHGRFPELSLPFMGLGEFG